MSTSRTYILSIAGFDPSSGAGLTSDIKTFDAHGLYGLSVCTCITVQNDIDFKSVNWISIDIIISQMETLFERFSIEVVKIGIVENWETLLIITNKLKLLNSKVKIVLDPVLKTSTGFALHSKENVSVLEEVLKQIYLITPNYLEIKALHPSKSISNTITYISSKTNLYLKGGHRSDKKGWDELYSNKTEQINIAPKAGRISEKHGSGCVLSSAIASNLSLNFDLEDASKNAKYYTEQFLNSNATLLGTHSKI